MRQITVEEARTLLKQKSIEAAALVARKQKEHEERLLAEAKARLDDSIQSVDLSIRDAIDHCQSETKFHPFEEPLNSLLVDHYKAKGFRVKIEFDEYQQTSFMYISWSEQPWPY